jgi:hypothetical protein
MISIFVYYTENAPLLCVRLQNCNARTLQTLLRDASLADKTLLFFKQKILFASCGQLMSALCPA